MIEWKKWSEVKPERNVMILAYNKKWKNLGNHGDDGIRYGFYDCKNDFVWANCDGEDEDFDSLRKKLPHVITELPIHGIFGLLRADTLDVSANIPWRITFNLKTIENKD